MRHKVGTSVKGMLLRGMAAFDAYGCRGCRCLWRLFSGFDTATTFSTKIVRLMKPLTSQYHIPILHTLSLELLTKIHCPNRQSSLEAIRSDAP